MKQDNKIDVVALKEKFGDIKVVGVGDLTGYFRMPDMKIWRFATKAASVSVTQFKVSLARNCFVGGDKELLETPYLEDVADAISNMVDYDEASVESNGNGYVVSISGKSCKLRPVTVEIQTESERDNDKDMPFQTQQNMLDRMWIEGDAEIRNEKHPHYLMPVLRVLKELREKHRVSLKNA